MGMTVAEAIARGDMEEFAAHLDPNVVWVGVSPGQLCRNRDQVLAIFEHIRTEGRRFAPEILVDTEELIVVDPHAEPKPDANPELHQVLVLDEGRVVEMRDYPDRASALAAAEGT